jgi:23S rRNA (uracil1939-C5)-methyltransferase
LAQIKDKCGIEKRLNYNLGDNKSYVPKCPLEKEKAIMAAFEHFNMI